MGTPTAAKEQVKQPRGPKQILNAVLMLGFLVSTGFIINVLQLLVYCLRPFALKFSQDMNSYLVDWHWATLVFMFSEWGGVNLHWFGDDVPLSQPAFGHMNHRSDVDWVLGFAFAWHRRSMGRMKIIMKSDFRFVPTLGFTMVLSDFIFAFRDWEIDRSLFTKALTKLKQFPNPMWMVVFPEGTRFTPNKQKKSCEYAKEHNLPVFNHVLLPRTKGWLLTMGMMRDKLERMVDATVSFPGREPTLLDLFCRTGQCDAYLHINYRTLADLPTDNAELEQWLYNDWAEKERMVEYVAKHGQMVPGVRHHDSHIGADTWPLIYLWLVVLAIVTALSIVFIPAVAWYWIFVGVSIFTTLVVIGILVLLHQRSSHKSRRRAAAAAAAPATPTTQD